MWRAQFAGVNPGFRLSVVEAQLISIGPAYERPSPNPKSESPYETQYFI